MKHLNKKPAHFRTSISNLESLFQDSKASLGEAINLLSQQETKLSIIHSIVSGNLTGVKASTLAHQIQYLLEQD